VTSRRAKQDVLNKTCGTHDRNARAILQWLLPCSLYVVILCVCSFALFGSWPARGTATSGGLHPVNKTCGRTRTNLQAALAANHTTPLYTISGKPSGRRGTCYPALPVLPQKVVGTADVWFPKQPFLLSSWITVPMYGITRMALHRRTWRCPPGECITSAGGATHNSYSIRTNELGTY
jgi:hypothetical protein